MKQSSEQKNKTKPNTKLLSKKFILSSLEKIPHSEINLKSLMDANVIGVTITDLDGRIFEANDIFLQMIGYNRADVKAGKLNWLDRTPQEYFKLNEEIKKTVLKTGIAKAFEKEYVRRDGTRVPVLISKVLIDKTSKKTIAFILDMSEQKELQHRKDEFIALAAHELKTPLTSLRLLSQLSKNELEQVNNKQLDEIFTKMDQQIKSVDKLITNLLDVSRLQSGKLTYNKRLFSFDKLIKETINELQKVNNRHTFMYTSTTKEKVRADKERIKQVLTNLTTNAVKYSPLADKVIIKLTKDAKKFTVSIKDFGTGISKEQKEKIFERYYQVIDGKNKRLSGLGLGLYLSKEIIDRHHGKITLRSEPGKGSTFSFTLPAPKDR